MRWSPDGKQWCGQQWSRSPRRNLLIVWITMYMLNTKNNNCLKTKKQQSTKTIVQKYTFFRTRLALNHSIYSRQHARFLAKEKTLYEQKKKPTHLHHYLPWNCDTTGTYTRRPQKGNFSPKNIPPKENCYRRLKFRWWSPNGSESVWGRRYGRACIWAAC